MKLRNLTLATTVILLPSPAYAQYFECETCPAGTWNNGNYDSCQKCAAGTFAYVGSSSCTKCPAGKYSTGGASSCTNCPAGTYSTAGSSSCTSCLTTGVATCDSTTGKATSCVKGFNYDSQKNVCNINCQAQGFLNATGVGESCQCEVIKVSDVITKIQNKDYKSRSECIEACSKSCGLSSEIATCYGNCSAYFYQNVEYHYCCKTNKPSCNCSCPPNGSYCDCAGSCQRAYENWKNGCFYTSDSCSGDHSTKVESL